MDMKRSFISTVFHFCHVMIQTLFAAVPTTHLASDQTRPKPADRISTTIYSKLEDDTGVTGVSGLRPVTTVGVVDVDWKPGKPAPIISDTHVTTHLETRSAAATFGKPVEQLRPTSPTTVIYNCLLAVVVVVVVVVVVTVVVFAHYSCLVS